MSMIHSFNTIKENNKKIILASKSSIRSKILEQSGLIFDICPADIDESMIKESLKAEGVSATDQAIILAKFKAEKVSMRYCDNQTFVIGVDQICLFKDQVLSKSQNVSEAKQVLQQLSGQQHRLITGMVVAVNGNEIWSHHATAEMTMRHLTDNFIDRYLEVIGPDILSSVGNYHIEGIGIQMFAKIVGDWSTIQGLSIVPLINFLREHNIVLS